MGDFMTKWFKVSILALINKIPIESIQRNTWEKVFNDSTIDSKIMKKFTFKKRL